MKRLIIVYSPRSARYSEVRRKVIQKSRELKGWMVLKFEVEEAPLRENAKKLAKIIRKDDLVLSAGGDGTASMTLNAIIESGKIATFAVMPFGNFNDYAETLGKLSFDKIIRKFEEGKYEMFYPLDAWVDGKHLMYSGAYFTIGLMAEATWLFKQKRVRKKLMKVRNRLLFSGRKMFGWYVKNKRRKDFLPSEMNVNGKKVEKNTTDYVAVNGKSIASVVPCRGWWKDSEKFWSGTMRNRSLMRMFRAFIRSQEGKLPGKESKCDHLSFDVATNVYMHADGEGVILSEVLEIEIRKSKNGLRVIQA